MTLRLANLLYIDPNPFSDQTLNLRTSHRPNPHAATTFSTFLVFLTEPTTSKIHSSPQLPFSTSDEDPRDLLALAWAFPHLPSL